jgi:hypothetical protein
MIRSILLTISAAVTCLILIGSPALAEFDVVPYDDGGKIVTGGHDDFEPDPTLADNEFQRVFGYEFGEEPMAPFVIEDPGANNEPAITMGYGTNNGALLPSAFLSFHAVTNLLYWDGTQPVDFGPAPDMVALGIASLVSMDEIRYFGTGNSTGENPGFGFTDANGRYHDHVLSRLYFDGDLDPAAPNAPDGMYLLGVEMTQLGLTASDAIYWVYLNNVGGSLGDDMMANAIHTKAIIWVEENLVPEPSMTFLWCFGLLAVRRRRVGNSTKSEHLLGWV